MSRRLRTLGVVLATATAAIATWASPSQASHQRVVGLTAEDPSRLMFFTTGGTADPFPQNIDFDGPGVDLVGIDFRPNSNLLYGYGENGVLYVLREDPLDLTEYDATPVNPSAASSPVAAGPFGFDFDPVADSARLVAAGGDSYLINADNGSLTGGDSVDYPPAAPFDPASTSAIAYSNSFPNLESTTLYAIDTANDLLTTVAADGTLTPVGPLGFDASEPAGFDILTLFPSTGPQNAAYAAFDVVELPGNGQYMWNINLSTGAASLTSALPIGGGEVIESIALPQVSTVRFSATTFEGREGKSAVVTVVRHGRNDRTPARIGYRTRIAEGDTAEASDFTPTSDVVEFPPGVTARSFTIPLPDDSATEGPERFQVEFFGEESRSLIIGAGGGSAKVVIADDDPALPALKPLISAPAQSVGQAARRVRAAISCNRDCKAGLALFAGKKKLSATTASLGKGGVRKVVFAIDGADREVMANRLTTSGLKLTIKGVFRAGGKTVRRTLSFRAHL